MSAAWIALSFIVGVLSGFWPEFLRRKRQMRELGRRADAILQRHRRRALK